MKNLIRKDLKYSLFLMLFLFSCASENEKKYKHYKKTTRHEAPYQEASSWSPRNSKTKFSYVVKPSESMAVGVEISKAKFNTIRDENKLPQKYDNVYGDIDEIMQDGHYVGRYKVGNPYQIEDITYYPQEYDDYEEVGVSSWYGDDFHGKQTANGEIYDSQSMTAAHQTLPLPSIVRVTNLENNRSALVRVNDRGPFAKSRIIDVSEKAAQTLGYRDKGTATVKVEFLSKETQELLRALKIKEE